MHFSVDPKIIFFLEFIDNNAYAFPLSVSCLYYTYSP